jgi:hypothetical protein
MQICVRDLEQISSGPRVDIEPNHIVRIILKQGWQGGARQEIEVSFRLVLEKQGWLGGAREDWCLQTTG